MFESHFDLRLGFRSYNGFGALRILDAALRLLEVLDECRPEALPNACIPQSGSQYSRHG